jgi:CRISPR/Cas system-associated exonuclease Cas4 (RecB family)
MKSNLEEKATMELKELLSKSLVGHDNTRPRSKQVAVGPSSIGDCRRKVYHILKQSPVTNPDTESLAAILGTFIHTGISESIKREDPFGDNFLIEHKVKAGNLVGHIDLYIKDEGLVVDWKTSKLKSLRYFPSQQQKWQVQVYGYLLEENGETPKQVALVCIPRDGNMADIKVHVENYNRETALKALTWLEEVQRMVDEDSPPPPEKHVSFCANYCSYWDPTGEVGCTGM